MLAGQNAAALRKTYKEFQQKAGRVHQADYLAIFPEAVALVHKSLRRNFPLRDMIIPKSDGVTFGTYPNWGEIDYQRTRSEYGYLKGVEICLQNKNFNK
ncbi:hypothetical protein [Polycladidibacter stylochi]|uniref:hypothetical protein n=1 Tax=Polycladidibacter stylochi TaxID=1807766 RepID=UPI00082A0C08|nr:hypothetical protein [Pseudovibrio stylochi]